MIKGLGLLMRIPKCKCGEYKEVSVQTEMTVGNFTGWIANKYCGSCEKSKIATREKMWQKYLKGRTNK